ncbi:hypothetical protein V7S43_017448 [Phytophthora oleae]|uniref:Ankyrin repeat-containing domain n=1 Tax=Phytophthora oleae TaxID=2107226 RepID=A0ABD3ET10_9STRA
MVLVRLAIDNGHIEAARWLYENIPTERDERKVRGAIEAALQMNDTELAESFVPPGRDVMEYASLCTGNIQAVERMIDSGYLQENSYVGAVAIRKLVDSGRLDLMQRVANLRYFPQRNKTEWVDMWQGVLKRLCYRGDCTMIQWALEHLIGRQACKLLKQNSKLRELLWNAVAGGYGVEVLQTLQDSGSVDKYGPLQVNRSEGLTTKAMDGAAANGHLHVVEWLHQHTSAGCTSNAMDDAAEYGHLSVLKWLYANRTEGCTSAAMRESLQDGHLTVASASTVLILSTWI